MSDFSFILLGGLRRDVQHNLPNEASYSAFPPNNTRPGCKLLPVFSPPGTGVLQKSQAPPSQVVLSQGLFVVTVISVGSSLTDLKSPPSEIKAASLRLFLFPIKK